MYASIGGEINEFALPSMYNFTFSVLKELQKENYKEFKERRVSNYSQGIKKTIKLKDDDKVLLFDQFFFAYKLMNNIKVLSELEDDEKIPLIQLSTIAFYYSAYSLANCFIFCHDKNIRTSHSKTLKAYNNFCNKLAFPFNVKGRFEDGSLSEFEIINEKDIFTKGFSYDPQVLKRKDLDGFDYKSAIYSYLKGTHKWYWENSGQLKRALKERGEKGYKNFRNNDAKSIRDKCFSTLPDVNFLSCLYRIRGKVNYRDSMFSLYALQPGHKYNYYEKAIRLPSILLNILRYFSIDVESYLKIRTDLSKFHENMLNDIISKTLRYNLEFPDFQKKFFYE